MKNSNINIENVCKLQPVTKESLIKNKMANICVEIGNDDKVNLHLRLSEDDNNSVIIEESVLSEYPIEKESDSDIRLHIEIVKQLGMNAISKINNLYFKVDDNNVFYSTIEP